MLSVAALAVPIVSPAGLGHVSCFCQCESLRPARFPQEVRGAAPTGCNLLRRTVMGGPALDADTRGSGVRHA